MENTKNEDKLNLSATLGKNFQLISSLNQKFWDMWMVNLGSLSWLNEQWDNNVNTYLAQRKATREEMVKVAEQLATQIQKNMTQVEDIVKEAWMSTVENIDVPGYKSYSDLLKQLDDLAKKIDPSK